MFEGTSRTISLWFQKITKRNKYPDGVAWNESNGGTNFTSGLPMVDVRRSLSIEGARNHPWFQNDSNAECNWDADAEESCLGPSASESHSVPETKRFSSKESGWNCGNQATLSLDDDKKQSKPSMNANKESNSFSRDSSSTKQFSTSFVALHTSPFEDRVSRENHRATAPGLQLVRKWADEQRKARDARGNAMRSQMHSGKIGIFFADRTSPFSDDHHEDAHGLRSGNLMEGTAEKTTAIFLNDMPLSSQSSEKRQFPDRRLRVGPSVSSPGLKLVRKWEERKKKTVNVKMCGVFKRSQMSFGTISTHPSHNAEILNGNGDTIDRFTSIQFSKSRDSTTNISQTACSRNARMGRRRMLKMLMSVRLGRISRARSMSRNILRENLESDIFRKRDCVGERMTFERGPVVLGRRSRMRKCASSLTVKIRTYFNRGRSVRYVNNPYISENFNNGEPLVRKERKSRHTPELTTHSDDDTVSRVTIYELL